jgi:hypothetical protein
MFVFSSQNSQFGKLTGKLSPPTFFMDFVNMLQTLQCKVLKKPGLKSLGAIF